MKHADYNQLVGMKVGNWTILKYNGFQPGGKCDTFHCICVCGKERDVRCYNIIHQYSTSCGCSVVHPPNPLKGTGEGKTRLHRCWDSMKKRCNCPTDHHYQWYGARGIKVCDDWNNSFQSFKKWALLNGYKDDLTIDRIDNEGDYCLENCRWITHREQCRNRRNNVLLTLDGITMCASEWSEVTGLKHSTIIYRKKKLRWDDSKTLTTLPKGCGRMMSKEERE